jgi:hypothetical protein
MLSLLKMSEGLQMKFAAMMHLVEEPSLETLLTVMRESI